MFIMIQVHYNNPQRRTGIIDSSGMRVWLTEKLRPIEVGQAVFGTQVLPYGIDQVLPPKTSVFTTYAYCTADCTKGFPAEGINVIGGLLHSHLAGKRLTSVFYALLRCRTVHAIQCMLYRCACCTVHVGMLFIRVHVAKLICMRC